MPYKYCKQCNKRLKQNSTVLFCGDICCTLYTNADVVYCKCCNKNIGKQSSTRRQFCGLTCANNYQKSSNKVSRVCIFCNNSFIVNKSSHRYKLCSPECEKLYAASTTRNNQRLSTLINNNLKNYNVKHTTQRQSVVDKTRVTKLNRYGDVGYNNIDKIRDTKLKNYGDVGYNNSDKAIETKMHRYGTLNFNDKANRTKLEKYGTLNFSKKSQQTALANYGTLNFSKNANATKLKRYGSFTNILIKNGYRKLKNKYKHLVEFLFCESDYTGSKQYKKYKFKCNNCSGEFFDYMTNGLSPTCNICFPSTRVESIEEKNIVGFIKSIYDGQIVENDRSILGGQELDVYLPEKKIAIEYNGVYWHSELSGNKDKRYHLGKTIECEKLGIRLIHILEPEWVNKQDIVKCRLKHILHGVVDKPIYARNCIIKTITVDTAVKFLNTYHLQGECNSSIQIGAFCNDVLVSVMTFGCLRSALGSKNIDNTIYEMYRFCVGDKNVVGIASKMLKYFIINFNPSKIISYADRRYSDNAAFYNKIGFNLVGKTSTNYWYFNLKDTLKLYHRFNF